MVVSGGRSRPALVEALEFEHYAVAVTGPDGALGTRDTPGEARRAAAIVVDVPLSLRLDICRALRQQSSAPLLVVGEPSAPDAAECLEAGADDFVCHPERPREVAARVRARLRRWPGSAPASNVLSVGPVTMDLDRHEVAVEGRPVYLPIKQFRLLELLLQHPDQVLPTQTIVSRLWGPADGVGANTLQAHVARLRAALGDPAASRVQSVPGLGYIFRR